MKLTIHVPESETRSVYTRAARACLDQAVWARDYGFRRHCHPDSAAQSRATMRENALKAVAFARASGVSLSLVIAAWRADYALRCACEATAA